MREQYSRPLVRAKWTRRWRNRSGTRKCPCCRGRCTCPHRKDISAALPPVHSQLAKARITPESESAAASELSNDELIASMAFVAPRKFLLARTERSRSYSRASCSIGSGKGSMRPRRKKNPPIPRKKNTGEGG